ncbi:MAG: iron-containing alcohol dehydrogenase [Solirubrobacterales bacterium]
MSGDFIWGDAGRVIVCREGGVGGAAQTLHEHGFDRFELLTTERALAEAKALGAAAEVVHELGPGQVPELAGALLDRVSSPWLVAFGGGRVIDATKAIASASGARVAAIPTTLSGAEMTGIHRLPAGAEQRVRAMVRPVLVLADPQAMTSQPEQQLRASAMNALAHGADSLYTPFANPVSRMTALRGAELIAGALDQDPSARDRAALAQGSLFSAYALDSSAFAIHHVVCQTLVRVCGTPHAGTNAAILPRVMAFMAPRAPDEIASLAAAIAVDPSEIEPRILELGGQPAGLGGLGADRTKLDIAIDSMLARPELAFTPRPPGRDELRELVDSAW